MNHGSEKIKGQNLRKPDIVKIEGYGVFQIRDIGEAPESIKRNARYGDLKALYNPETEQWLDISHMRFLRG